MGQGRLERTGHTVPGRIHAEADALQAKPIPRKQSTSQGARQHICAWAQGACTQFGHRPPNVMQRPNAGLQLKLSNPCFPSQAPGDVSSGDTAQQLVHLPSKWQAQTLPVRPQPSRKMWNSSTFCELLTLPGRLLFGLSVQPQAVTQVFNLILKCTFHHVVSGSLSFLPVLHRERSLTNKSFPLNGPSFLVVMVGLRVSRHSPLSQKVQGARGISWHRNSEAHPKNKWSFSSPLPTRHGNDSKFKIKASGFPANLETACAREEWWLAEQDPKMSCQRECSSAHTARDKLQHRLPGQILFPTLRMARCLTFMFSRTLKL